MTLTERNKATLGELWFARTMLFTPADRPERFPKAEAVGADGAIVDLEDGVGLSNKDMARSAAVRFFASAQSTREGFVWAARLNHVTTAAGLADLLAFRAASALPRVFVLPKTESVAEVDIAVEHLSRNGAAPTIVALVESGRGLAAAEAIAAHAVVGALGFGGADLATDLGAVFEWEPMLFARSRVMQAAATAHIPAFDVPFLDIQNVAALKQETHAAKALGFSCKLAIHPRQVSVINAVFTPTAAELATAKRIVSAAEAANGNVIQLDGHMVDAPVVKAARRTVRLAAKARP